MNGSCVWFQVLVKVRKVRWEINALLVMDNTFVKYSPKNAISTFVHVLQCMACVLESLSVNAITAPRCTFINELLFVVLKLHWSIMNKPWISHIAVLHSCCLELTVVRFLGRWCADHSITLAYNISLATQQVLKQHSVNSLSLLCRRKYK